MYHKRYLTDTNVITTEFNKWQRWWDNWDADDNEYRFENESTANGMTNAISATAQVELDLPIHDSAVSQLTCPQHK